MKPSDPLAAAIEEFYARRRPERLGVAVSGGSDSLALLHLLHDWGGAELFAVTVNHGLRPEAASEALHVEKICAGLGIPHTILEWKGWDGRGNLQDQARRTRYAMIAEWGRGLSLDAVALGHTMDDQAETLVMRLARSAGVDGLSGMDPRVTRHGVEFHRPLLVFSRRKDLQALLDDRGVRWVDDPSNEDESFERVRARKAMALLAPLGIDSESLSDTALHMRSARRALDWFTREIALEIGQVVAGDVIFDRAALRRPPDEIMRRLLAGALQWVASADYPPRSEPMIRAEIAVARKENTTLHGCRVLVSDMTVRITREQAAVANLRSPTTELWDNRWTLDGPHAPELEVRALGEAVKDCPGWRETRLPRATLLASPAIWRGDSLVAAPVAGLAEGWSAETGDIDGFASFLISH